MFPDLFTFLDNAFPSISTPKSFSHIPTVKKVIDKNPTTVVHFTDGTFSKVTLSKNDTYNLETAILYAIIKRIYGTVDSNTHEASCSALGKTLKKIIETKTFHAKPKTKISSKTFLTPEDFFAPDESSSKKAPEIHCGKDNKPKSKISLKIQDLDAFKNFPLPLVASKKALSEKNSSSKDFKSTYTLRNSAGYVRPSKPFSEFTQEEKRAYWRFQKAKCKARCRKAKSEAKHRK